ncbi:MAG TPA: hypothetical protein VK747_07815 [Blastocatellia bacterium]|jgi:hypothetical protein|nr:hypothetical protein [Blastocatellia bacterium]
MTKAIAGGPGTGCLTPMMQQGLVCGTQYEIVSDDNEFTVKWRRRFDWKKRS